MLRVLVVSSTSDMIHQNHHFQSMGCQATYVVLDKSIQVKMNPFLDQLIYYKQSVFAASAEKNRIPAAQVHYQNFSSRLRDLQGHIFASRWIKRNEKGASFKLQQQISNHIDSLAKDDILDVKFNNRTKKIQIEVKNKGVVEFDHLFIEETTAVFEYLKKINPQLVHSESENESVFMCYEFNYTHNSLGENEFWFVEDRQYDSFLDNWFYLQSGRTTLKVWCFVPDHQQFNKEYHQFIQQRIKDKVESEFQFVQIYFKERHDGVFPFEKSNKWSLKDHARMTEVPSFILYSQEQTNHVFAQLKYDLHRLHKIKNQDEVQA